MEDMKKEYQALEQKGKWVSEPMMKLTDIELQYLARIQEEDFKYVEALKEKYQKALERKRDSKKIWYNSDGKPQVK